MIYLILGRTSTGKDTLGNLLEKEGINQIISKTTRKKRNEEDKHIFVDENTYNSEKENILTETIIDENHYYITNDMLKDDSFYIIDPEGAKKLIERTPDKTYYIFYVNVKDKNIRQERFLNRDQNTTIEDFNKRDNSEDKMFRKFESDIANNVVYDNFTNNLVKINILENSTNDKKHLEVFAKEIKRLTIQFKRVKSLVNILVKENIITSENNKVKITIDDNENTPYDIYKNIDEVSYEAMYDKYMLSDLIIPLLSMKDDSKLKMILKSLQESI